jgi:hypothetical protein
MVGLPDTKKIRNILLTPWKLKWYFLSKLPSGFWWSLRVKKLDLESCEVLIPYTWRTKNPFKSIYFAALAGAAELSTGTLALLAIASTGNISMLVTGFKAKYYKKACEDILFVCSQGSLVQSAVKKAYENREPQQIEIRTTGYNKKGETICEVWVDWSFKAR